MKKLALLAAMVFAFAVGANAMSPDDNLTQLSKDTKAKTEAMKKYNDALKDEVKAKKEAAGFVGKVKQWVFEKAQKKINDADKNFEKAQQKVKDAENKVKDAQKKAENARNDYNKAVEKAKKAEQKTLEMKQAIDKMDGIILNDGYNR